MIATEDATLEVLVFELGAQRYALRAPDVREITRAVTVAPLPRAPAVVEGVINVRGTVVPVLDIRARFGLPARLAEHTDHLLLAWANERLVALRVDRAASLVKLAPSDVESPTHLAAGLGLLAGVAKLPDGLVLIHDLSAFLTQAEAIALDDALAPAEQVTS
jgi:purine-binding chemotaxis protein CheW